MYVEFTSTTSGAPITVNHNAIQGFTPTYKNKKPVAGTTLLLSGREIYVKDSYESVRMKLVGFWGIDPQ